MSKTNPCWVIQTRKDATQKWVDKVYVTSENEAWRVLTLVETRTWYQVRWRKTTEQTLRRRQVDLPEFCKGAR